MVQVFIDWLTHLNSKLVSQLFIELMDQTLYKHAVKFQRSKPGVRCPTGEARITPLVHSLIHFDYENN
jgi:hypothetical protein